jgi:hypothetical protein
MMPTNSEIDANIRVPIALEKFAESLRLPLREFIAKLKGELPNVTRESLRRACLTQIRPVTRSAPTIALRLEMQRKANRVLRDELQRAGYP